jgi:hypothetical protein
MPLGDDLDPIARWRWLAADPHEAADQMTDPEAKLLLLSIAQAYESLAQRAEDRSTQPAKHEYADRDGRSCTLATAGGGSTPHG